MELKVTMQSNMYIESVLDSVAMIIDLSMHTKIHNIYKNSIVRAIILEKSNLWCY